MSDIVETPYQRVGRLQRERKEAREAAAKAARRRSISGGRWRSGAHRHNPANKHRWQESYEDRLDDLGHSPDF